MYLSNCQLFRVISLATRFRFVQFVFLTLLSLSGILLYSCDQSQIERTEEFLNDSIKVVSLNQEAFAVLTTNVDSALLLADQAMELARQHNWPYGIAVSMHHKSQALYHKNEYQEANAINSELLKMSDSLGLKEIGARARIILANVKADFEDFEQAIVNYEAALAMGEEIGHKLIQLSAIVNLGIIYLQEDDLDRAISSYKKGLEVLSDMDTPQKDYYRAAINSNLGNAYRKKVMGDSAKYYLQKTIDITEPNGFHYIAANTYYSFAEVYNQEGDYQSGLKHGTKALDASQRSNAKDYESNAWYIITESYKGLGQFEKGLEALEESIVLKDSVLADLRKTIKVQSQNELERQEALSALETEQQRKVARNRLIIAIIVGVFLIISLLLVRVLFLQRRKITTSRDQLQMAHDRLQEVNDEVISGIRGHYHRVTNVMSDLNSKLSWYQSQEQDENSMNYPKIYQSIGNTIKLFDFLQHNIDEQTGKPLQQIKAYLDDVITTTARSFAMIDKVDMDVNIEEVSTSFKFMLNLGQIANELISNSAKHAFSMQNGNGALSISIYRKEDHLHFDYTDNGPGFDPDKVKFSQGMDMIQILVRNLRGKMDITNKGKGAEFAFAFPLDFEQE